MKIRLLITAMLLFTGVMTSVAQNDEAKPRKTAEQRTDQVMEEMTNELQLTADQQTQIRDIVLLREKKRDAGRLSDEEKKEFKKQIHAILSPEQQKKMHEKKQAEQGKGKKHGQKSGSKGQPAQEQQVAD